MAVIIFSVLILIMGILEAALMNLGFIPFITIGCGLVMTVASAFRKKTVNLIITIIAFLAYAVPHVYIFLDMLFSYGASSSPYFFLTIAIFLLPIIFFICAFVFIAKMGKKTVAKKKAKNTSEPVIPAVQNIPPVTGANDFPVIPNLRRSAPDFVFCPNCGAKQIKGTPFCDACGTSCKNLISAREYDEIHSIK